MMKLIMFLIMMKFDSDGDGDGDGDGDVDGDGGGDGDSDGIFKVASAHAFAPPQNQVESMKIECSCYICRNIKVRKTMF